MSSALHYQKVHPRARAPTLREDGAFVVYAGEEVNIPSRGSAIVATGLYVVSPARCMIRSLSAAAAFSHSLETSSFCSVNYPNPHRMDKSPPPVELKLKVYNHGDCDHLIKLGHPVGAITIVPITIPELLETVSIEEIIAHPPAEVTLTQRKVKVPTTAQAWFRQMFLNDREYVKANFLNEKVLKELEEMKKKSDYKVHLKPDVYEATYAWGLLDETVKERVRRDLAARSEQELRVAQMAGTPTDKLGKKKTEIPDLDEDEMAPPAKPESPDGENELKAAEKEEEEPEPVLKPAPKAAAKPAAHVEEEEVVSEKEEEEEEEEPAPKPAAKPAPKAAAKPAAHIEEESEESEEKVVSEEEKLEEEEEKEEEEEPAPQPKPAAPKAAPKPAPKAAAKPAAHDEEEEVESEDEEEPAPQPKPAAPKAAPKPAAPKAGKKAAPKPAAHIEEESESEDEEPVELKPAAPKPVAKPVAKNPALKRAAKK